MFTPLMKNPPKPPQHLGKDKSNNMAVQKPKEMSQEEIDNLEKAFSDAKHRDYIPNSNCAINMNDLKSDIEGKSTTTTINVGVVDDGLTEKERLVQDLVKEGAIDIKEALVLLARDDPAKSIWINPDAAPKDWSYPSTGSPYFGGMTYTSSNVPNISNFA